MAKTVERIPIAPAVMRWARESISLDEGAAAKRLSVSIATLEKWETGELEPTIVQVRKMAQQYKRPLAVLLLPDPPTDFDAMRDFRRASDAGQAWSPDLHGEFRRALEQRDVFVDLARSTPDSVPVPEPVPSIDRQMDPESAGELLRQYLDISVSKQLRWRDQFQALNEWIMAIEAKGIIVIQTQGVGVDEMRGFSVSEWPYPVIALNGSDFPRGRTFTLLHELTHLGINSGGLCDLHEVGRNEQHRPNDDLEHFCNQVAAATLLPRDALFAETLIQSANANHDWSLEELSGFAQRFHVSSEAFLLRLISVNKATWETYRKRKPELEAEYKNAMASRKEKRKQSTGGPSFYRTKARNIGHGYAATVLDAFSSHAISSRDVSDFLDIKFNQLDALQAEIRQ